jgi:hypothetical protein
LAGLYLHSSLYNHCNGLSIHFSCCRQAIAANSTGPFNGHKVEPLSRSRFNRQGLSGSPVLRVCTHSTVYPSGNPFSIHHIKRQSIYVQQPFSPGPLSTGELPNTSVHPLTRFCPAGVLFPCLDLLGPSREVARFLFGPCKV